QVGAITSSWNTNLSQRPRASSTQRFQLGTSPRLQAFRSTRTRGSRLRKRSTTAVVSSVDASSTTSTSKSVNVCATTLSRHSSTWRPPLKVGTQTLTTGSAIAPPAHEPAVEGVGTDLEPSHVDDAVVVLS